jgi:hypothetical protein
MRILEVVLVGAGATLCIDLWALLLKKAFGVRSLDYCMLGRWVLHMPDGKFAHEAIGASQAKAHECKVGWAAHYSIGVAFAVMFVLLARDGWMDRPTLLPAFAFGLATVVVPFLTVQPAFGLGIAASRTNNPRAARVKSLVTHAVFGAGIFASAVLLGLMKA